MQGGEVASMRYPHEGSRSHLSAQQFNSYSQSTTVCSTTTSRHLQQHQVLLCRVGAGIVAVRVDGFLVVAEKAKECDRTCPK